MANGSGCKWDRRAAPHATPLWGESDGVDGTMRGPRAQMFIYRFIYLWRWSLRRSFKCHDSGRFSSSRRYSDPLVMAAINRCCLVISRHSLRARHQNAAWWKPHRVSCPGSVNRLCLYGFEREEAVRRLASFGFRVVPFFSIPLFDKCGAPGSCYKWGDCSMGHTQE
jgi:hypothetical protein